MTGGSWDLKELEKNTKKCMFLHAVMRYNKISYTSGFLKFNDSKTHMMYHDVIFCFSCAAHFAPPLGFLSVGPFMNEMYRAA